MGQKERELSAKAAATAGPVRPSAKQLEKERQALGNAAFNAKYAPTAEERQLRKERDETSFMAHVLEQRIVDIECDAAWEVGVAAEESEARPTKAARVA